MGRKTSDTRSSSATIHANERYSPNSASSRSRERDRSRASPNSRNGAATTIEAATNSARSRATLGASVDHELLPMTCSRRFLDDRLAPAAQDRIPLVERALVERGRVQPVVLLHLPALPVRRECV